MEKRIIQSYVYVGDEKYFVSTIHRPSSALSDHVVKYYETFSWKLNKDGEHGEFFEDNSGAMSLNGALKQHSEVCDHILIKNIN